MEKFRKQELKINSKTDWDNGIEVSRLIELIDANEFNAEIIDLLEIDNLTNDFIKIKGASTLFNVIKALNRKFIKIDLTSSLENISLYTEDDFTINFHNLQEDFYLAQLNKSNLRTKPIYSASRDFFSNLYQMDKYASRLIDAGHKDIVMENIKMLKEKHKNHRKYRLLHDIEDDIFYLRGIVSTNNYFNYDNNLAIVIGLLTLHKEMKSNNKEYRLKLCEYNESSIRMFFESSVSNELENIGQVKNIIEISNDEIKREALKFSGVCSILFQDSQENSKEIFIKPKEIKSKILSIRHNQSPSTAIPELQQIKNTEIVHNELFDDIVKIKNIKNPEQIKFVFRDKVENARRDELKIYKEDILKVLYKKVDNIIQLLELFDKINLLADRDIEVKEYLRFLMYEVLIKK